MPKKGEYENLGMLMEGMSGNRFRKFSIMLDADDDLCLVLLPTELRIEETNEDFFSCLIWLSLTKEV